MRTLGQDRIRTHNAELVADGQRLVSTTMAELWPRSAAASPARAVLDLDQHGQLGDPTVSMRLVPLPPGIAADRDAAVGLRTRLATEHRVEVAFDTWRGQVFLRLSGQIYNRIEDYDRLSRALTAVLRAA